MVLEKKMTCGEMEQRLILNYYGELDPVEKREMEQHLTSCAGCAKFGDRLKGMLDRVGETAFPLPPDEFWQTFSRDVRERIDSRRKGKGWWGSAWSVLKPVPLFVTLVVVGLFSFSVLFWYGRHSPEEMVGLPTPHDVEMVQNLEFLEEEDLLEEMDLLTDLDTALPEQEAG